MKRIMLRCMGLVLPAMVVATGMSSWSIAASPGDPVDAMAPYFVRPTPGPKAVDERGFIRRWLLLEPIRQPIRSNAGLGDRFVQGAVKAEYFADQFRVVPRDGDRVTVDGAELAWHALDAERYDVKLFSFASALGKPTYNILFWAVTVIDCPEETAGVRLAVGSNSASIWWVNGKEVIGIYGDRHMLVDDGVSKRLTLGKGANVVRCAVINGPGLSDFCARFIDEDGRPVKGLSVDLGARLP